MTPSPAARNLLFLTSGHICLVRFGVIDERLEIFDAGSKSKMHAEPYVRKVWELINDNTLFSKSPDYLASLRRSLLRDALAFFGEKSAYYRNLYDRLHITPRNADFPDLAKLAIPSYAPGDGHKATS
jgi:hypothetical protein